MKNPCPIPLPILPQQAHHQQSSQKQSLGYGFNASLSDTTLSSAIKKISFESGPHMRPPLTLGGLPQGPLFLMELNADSWGQAYR